MNAFKIELTDAPPAAAREVMVQGLLAYNAGFLGPGGGRALAVLLRDADGAVKGGLWGRTAYGWLFVELLFIPESLRGAGLGAELLGQAEAEARLRGCDGVWLDTMNPMAVGFYQRRGYAPFGTLPDYPKGNDRVFFWKALSLPPGHVSDP